jgi:hypothetical protein
VYDSWKNEWLVRGDTASKPALYGIWDVEQFSLDGQIRPPIPTDQDRFRRVIFDSGIIWELNINAEGGAVAFQRPDDTFTYYRTSIDVLDKTLTLTYPGHGRKDWNAHFTFERPSADQLVLDGDIDKHKLHMQLHLFDRSKFELVSSGFHWVQ